MVEVLYIIITIGLTIFMHELGHFMTAKKLGITVEKFAIGWGPPLLSFKKNGTEYIIALFFFLGGYVKMAGENPGEASAQPVEGGFLQQPVWKKIAVSVAGVFMNAVFAVLLMWTVYMAGTETLRPVIGEVTQGYPAREAGLAKGDTVTEVNGKKVRYWSELSEILAASTGDVSIKVVRDGRELAFTIKPRIEEYEDLLREKKTKQAIGIKPLYNLTVIDEARAGYPAAAAGIKSGDRIVSMDGKKITYWEEISDAVKASMGREMTVELESQAPGGKYTVRTVKVTPKKEMVDDADKKKVETWVIGIIPKGNMVPETYGPVEALVKGAQQCWYFTDLTVRSVGKMITRKIEPDVAGPIGVAQIAYKVAKTGLVNLLLLIAIININLAIFNLLPLVPFDGGLVLMFLIEGIRGKMVPLKVQEVLMEIGWFLVIALIVFVTYGDIMRIVKGG